MDLQVNVESEPRDILAATVNGRFTSTRISFGRGESYDVYKYMRHPLPKCQL